MHSSHGPQPLCEAHRRDCWRLGRVCQYGRGISRNDKECHADHRRGIERYVLLIDGSEIQSERDTGQLPASVRLVLKDIPTMLEDVKSKWERTINEWLPNVAEQQRLVVEFRKKS